MYFDQKERKFVQVSCAKLWHVALGANLERYYDSKPWGLHASVVDKKTAQEFLDKGLIFLDGGDQSIVVNLRQRYKQAIFVPSELPEHCGSRDRILLIRKRLPGEIAEAGYDNRYHFFLFTWMEPSQMILEFTGADPVEGNGKVVALSSRRKCDHGSKPKRHVSSDLSDEEQALSTPGKRGTQKGLSRGGQRNRWRF